MMLMKELLQRVPSSITKAAGKALCHMGGGCAAGPLRTTLFRFLEGVGRSCSGGPFCMACIFSQFLVAWKGVHYPHHQKNVRWL